MEKFEIRFPMICHRTKDNAFVEDAEDIEIGDCTINDPEVFNVMEQLLHAERLKPGMLKFLVDNNVFIEVLPKLEGTDIEGGWIPATGSAMCVSGHGHIKLKNNPKIETIMHEFAHCKEDVERDKKGLPGIKSGKTGGWKPIHPESPNFIPLGHEARAVHFENRMELKRRKELEEMLEV